MTKSWSSRSGEGSVSPLTLAEVVHRAVEVCQECSSDGRDEVDADPVELLRLAARAEFHGGPPEAAARWLADQGIKV
jgi:hypothetical protein